MNATTIRPVHLYALRLSWQPDTTVGKFSCNAKVRDSFRSVLENVPAHYGANGIRELRLGLYGGATTKERNVAE